jgi:NhaC family Na+:H+ antiporter
VAKVHRAPSLTQAVVPVLFLVGMLAASVSLFGDASSAGPNQIALMLSAAVAAMVGVRNGFAWSELEAGIVRGISTAMGAMLILLVVGALIGAWILAGIVPVMIDYGLWLLTPRAFYAAACAICCLVALATGSSWTTAGTVGVALVGVATVQGLHLGLAAGAVISGAYFGDKMSPLSDTTNLAPAMAGTDLFTHIRYMTWTTGPSILIALVLFGVVGAMMAVPQETGGVEAIRSALNDGFVLDWHLLLPVALVLALVVRRVPALPALVLGTLAGGLFAMLFQQEVVLAYADEPSLWRPVSLVKGVWISLFDGYVSTSGSPELDELLSRGGISSMLPTIWLIVSAMTFGGVMETTGLLQRLGAALLGAVRGTGTLVGATMATAFSVNVLASDQYMAIVLPGRMYRAEYERRGVPPQVLSRALEDAGTLTSPLVPWNTCGVFMAQVLGVATFTYAPFAFFNLLNPLVAAFYAATGFTITRHVAAPSVPGDGRGST